MLYQVLAMKATCYCCERLAMRTTLENFITQPFTSSSFGFELCNWADVVRFFFLFSTVTGVIVIIIE